MGQHLTVYRVKDEFAEACEDTFESLLRGLEDVEVFGLTEEMTFDPVTETPFEAQLFVSIPELSLPSWVDFLKEGFADIPEAQTQSPRAILVIRIPYEDKNEVFAFTFGHGRYLLNPKSYDQNYGLRVALNAIYEEITGGNPINPNRIRSVTARTIDTNPIRTRHQADRKASFATFGIDIQRDILSAVTGMPMRAGAWGTRISGSNSLSANPDIEFEGLGNYCKLVADTFRKATYKDVFPFIENLRLITDKTEVSAFETDLVKILQDEPKKISLAVPEDIDFDQIAHFRFLFDVDETSGEFVDPDDANLAVLKDREPDSAKLLENIRERWFLQALSDQGEVEHDWPILDCLSLELPRGEKTYVLSDGNFFEIDSSFIRELDSFIQGLRKTDPCPPECRKSTEEEKYSEGDYNSDAASGTQPFLCMDRKLVYIQDDQEKTTPIEVCDLYTEDGCFIHVKKNHGSSALSHLFLQGFTSAVLFLNSRAYREAALEKMKAAEAERAAMTGDSSFIDRFSTFSMDAIEPQKFEVSYAIIDEWDGKEFDSLPLFSKVTLRKNVDDLRRMGYKVSVTRINIV